MLIINNVINKSSSYMYNKPSVFRAENKKTIQDEGLINSSLEGIALCNAPIVKTQEKFESDAKYKNNLRSMI